MHSNLYPHFSPVFSSVFAGSGERLSDAFKRTCICAALLCVSLLTSAADCVTPATGLVGWWRAENSGADVTGAHDGSFPYGIAFAGGEAGQAFDFDSSFRRLSIPDSPAFQLTNAMTLEGWVYPRAYGGFICFRGDNRPGLDTWVLDTYQSGYVNFQIDDEANNYASVRAPLVLNQWQHVAATWDRTSGDMKIYVNGTFVTQTNTTIIPIGVLDPGSEPAIGIGNHGGTFHQFPLNGLVDEFAIYNRALADSEILSIYNASTAGKCLPAPPSVCAPAPAGLVGFWRGDGNTLDATGNNPGALTGDATFGTGRVGQGFSFDGDGDLVPVGSALALQLQNFTIETWIRRTSPLQVSYGSYGNGVIFGYGQNGYGLYLDPNGVPALSKIGISETKPATSITDTSYHHLAVTKTGSSVVFYIDGAAYSAPDYDPGFAFETVAAIGARGDNLDNSFLGFVDEVSVYNRALGSAELQSIFNAGSAGKCAVSNPPPLCAPAPSGLVGLWRADGNPSDAIGTNHGTLANVAGFATGKVGQALNFDGSNAGMIIPASPTLNVGAGAGFSIETWINPTTIDLERPIVEWNSVTGGNPYPYGVHLWISVPVGYGAGPGCLYANIVDTAGSFHWLSSAGGLITTNRFQHVALTYDKVSGLATLYLDGHQVASQNLGTFTPQTSYNLYLGNRPGGEAAAFSWEGQLDEVSLYDRTLAGTEILAIYNAGSAGKCAPTPPPSCVTIPTGLVGWWRAEANGNDVTGTNNGSLVNGAGFAPGNVGQSFSFDGADDHFDIPASPSLDVGTANGLTFETWVKPSSIAMQVVAEWNNGSGGVGSHLWLSVDHTVAGDGVGNILVNLYDTTETSHGILSPAGVMTANEWQHIAVTYDKTTGNAVLYRNGTVVSSQNLGVFTPQTSYDLHLGYRASSAFFGTYFGGLMDEPSLYNRALGASEIQSIYDAGSFGKCAPPSPPTCTPPSPGLVGWWKAEADANDTAGANNGDALNGVQFTNGVVGQAFYFDGVDDRVLVPSSSSLNFGPGADFSVEAWIKPEVAATDFGVQSIANKRFTPDFLSAVGWEFGLVDGKLTCQLADAPLSVLDFSTFVAPGPDLRDGQFHHVALSVQRNSTSGGKLMVDGQVVLVFDPTSQPGDLSTTEPLRIGSHADAALNSHFTGAVDEVGVYNLALSEADVLAIYNSGGAGKCAPVPVDQFILAGPITNSANGHAYYLTTELSWHDAEALGVRLGGHLTTINDNAENNWVFNTFSSWGERDRELWIGLTDELNESDWRWSSGGSSAYRHWLDGQPDNFGDEDYAHFWMPNVGAPPGTWNDAPGYLSHYGVIEVGADEPSLPNILAGPITNSVNGHWYYLTTELLWHDAEALGVSLGGHLTTIDGDDENNWVFSTFSSWDGMDRELWIGLTDEVNEGEWLWSSGSSSAYRHWLDGQPDNYGNQGGEGGGGGGEDYAHFWMPNVGAPPGTWNDAPGYLSHYGVIEVGNAPFQPVAMPDSLSTGTNTPVSFNAGKLLLNDIEPRGLALSVASVSSNSALGGTVALIKGSVHYTPPPDFSGNDVFTYSITNVHGSAASSTVTATVGSGGHVPLNITFGPVVDDGQFVVRFAGVPGLAYTIEAASGVDGPWTKVTNVTAPITDTGFGIGVFEFREPVGAFESRFYRTIYPAY